MKNFEPGELFINNYCHFMLLLPPRPANSGSFEVPKKKYGITIKKSRKHGHYKENCYYIVLVDGKYGVLYGGAMEKL